MGRSEILKVEVVWTTSQKVKKGEYFFRLEECPFSALDSGVGKRFLLSRPGSYKTCYKSAPIVTVAEDWGLDCILTASGSEFGVRVLD